MTIRQLTPPESEPVTLEQAKGFVRVDTDADDALLSLLITAARQEAEAITGAHSGNRRGRFPSFVVGMLEVPLVPARACGGGCGRHGGQTLNSTVSSLPGWSCEPAREAVFTPGPDFPGNHADGEAGHPAERFPEPIRQWMLVRIGTLYEQRESFCRGVKLQ